MASSHLSIIIVDDLQFSRVVIKTALKKAGYDGIRMAECASEALAMLEQQPADVVLADWMMPEMDGLELTQKIRQRDEENGCYTAVILFTAHDGVEYLVKALDNGVDDYLCKPPNPQELAARVNAAARIAALQNDLLETSRQLQRTIDDLKESALVDELTGAGNQQFLVKNLNSHLKEAAARQGGFSLVLVELKELQSLQNTHGDAIVDEILVSQHRRLRRAVRPTDVVARMDNNLFGIIIRHTNIKHYKASSIDRILTMINNRAYKTSLGNLVIKGCIGVYFHQGGGPVNDATKIIQHAKQKLNQARNDISADIAY